MFTDAELAEKAALVYHSPWSGALPGHEHWALLGREHEDVVVFPGTDPQNAIDWARDFRIWPPMRLGSLGWVHAGFGAAARAEFAKILPELPTDKLVTFTGHSLGGAVAILAGALFAYVRPHQAFRVVTFGAPRTVVLNRTIGRALAGRARLWARRGDVVPAVPFRPLYGHPARPTPIGVSTLDWLQDHAIARYAQDLASRANTGEPM